MKLTASTTRLILSFLLIVTIGIMFAGSYFAYNFLQKTAKEVSDLQSETATTDAKIQNILYLKKQLENNKDIVDKANNIAAESQSYRYQDQIIEDFVNFAQKANVTIASYSFNEGDSNKKTTKNSKLNSRTVTIQIGNDVTYEQYLHFLYLVEQNVTRMQIQSISIDGFDGNNEMKSPSVDVEVYVK